MITNDTPNTSTSDEHPGVFTIPAAVPQPRIHAHMLQRAEAILFERLETYGNRLGEAQRTALRQVITRMGALLIGCPGRWAFGLECGVGKTQAAIAFVQAAHETGQLGPGGRSIVICCAQTEALCSIARDLRRYAPALSLGMKHTYKLDPAYAKWATDPVSGLGVPPEGYMPSGPKTASLRSDDNAEDCAVLLVTHMRVNKGKLDSFYKYMGRDRDLVIYDESLFRSDPTAILWQHLDEAMTLAIRRNPAPVALEFLKSAQATLTAELSRQAEAPDAVAGPVRLDNPPDYDTVAAITAELGAVLLKRDASPMSRDAAVLISKLLKVSGNPMTITAAGHPSALLSFEPSIDDAIDRVAILDASFRVRKLYEYDDIKDGMEGVGVVKRFDNVTLHFTRQASGRGGVMADMAKGASGFYVPYVANAIRQAPPGEAVLVFTFGKKTECEANLRCGLTSMGIDLEELTPNGKRRINVLPWGQETSRSDMKFCTTVIYAGVMYRSLYGINAAIKGQARDIGLQTTSHEVRAVLASELVHAIMQSCQRGSARSLIDGQAGKMVIHLPMHEHRNEVRKGLKAAMPGLVWLAVADDAAEYAEAITGHLDTLGPEVTEVSKVALGRAVVDKLGRTMDRRATDRGYTLWQEDAATWTLEDRQVHRKQCEWRNQSRHKQSVSLLP